MELKQASWWTTNRRSLYWIGGILLLNVLAGQAFIRWDLTAEKRYSLSPISKETVRELSYPMEVTVFLEGAFPIQIRRYQEALNTTLYELKQYSRSKLQLNFVDPTQAQWARDTLRKYGFRPVPVRVQSSATEMTQKAMYPVIHLQYGERSRYLDVMQDFSLPNGEIDLVRAEANLEYKLVAGIRSLIRETPLTVAFLQGHGEHPIQALPNDVGREFQLNYNWGIFDMRENPGLPIDRVIDVLVVMQPTAPFSERDKYELDQYLMRGGSILWMLDLEQVDLDVFEKRSTLTQLYELNLDDLFFTYGFKVNADLIQDLQSEQQEFFLEGPSGGSFRSEPWPFYPLVSTFPDLPVTRNVDLVLLRNAGSIDTFSLPGVSKSVFMRSSPQSRKLPNVQYIDLNEVLLAQQAPQLFSGQGPFITGILSEGAFPSSFQGRKMPDTGPGGYRGEVPPFEGQALPGSKLAVISDGEFALGKYFRGKRGFSPYDNRSLLLNLIDYLGGDDLLSSVRAKEVAVRPLNPDKVRQYATWIRWGNLVFPLVLLVLFGGLRFLWRKRTYSIQKKNQ